MQMWPSLFSSAQKADGFLSCTKVSSAKRFVATSVQPSKYARRSDLSGMSNHLALRQRCGRLLWLLLAREESASRCLQFEQRSTEQPQLRQHIAFHFQGRSRYCRHHLQLLLIEILVPRVQCRARTRNRVCYPPCRGAGHMLLCFPGPPPLVRSVRL